MFLKKGQDLAVCAGEIPRLIRFSQLKKNNTINTNISETRQVNAVKMRCYTCKNNSDFVTTPPSLYKKKTCYMRKTILNMTALKILVINK